MYFLLSKLFLANILLVVIQIAFCQTPSSPNELQGTDQAKTQEELFRTLSKSKASVWVDTNKGDVSSTSAGSSNLERGSPLYDEPDGYPKNMLLTLLIQPDSSRPVSAVPPQSRESNLKPILLLQQQQHDLSQILLEKQEKFEKMNIQLQQQIKHQHSSVLDLLEHISLFLEVIKTPGVEKLSKEGFDQIQSNFSKRILNAHERPHSTSSSSTANAVVTSAENKNRQKMELNQTPEPFNHAHAPPSPLLESQQSSIIGDPATPSSLANTPMVSDNPPEVSTSLNPEITTSIYPLSEVSTAQNEPDPNANMSVSTQNNPDSTIATIGPTTRPPVIIPRRSKIRFNSKKDKPIEVGSDSEVKGMFRDALP